MTDVEVIGVPLDLGADRRGVDMGPSAIRIAGLSDRLKKLGHRVKDAGNVSVPIAEETRIKNPSAKYLPEVSQVSRELANSVAEAMGRGELPLVLGGDHSIAIGTLAGVFDGRSKKETGVLWLDAHGDFNTPDITPSGNIHGMSLAVSAGLGHKWFPSPPWPLRSVDPSRIAIVGARELDPQERINLEENKIKVFSMADIDRIGMQEVMTRAINVASGKAGDNFHVSFDIDVVDPTYAPGVGTPVRGGITYREAHLAMEMIYETKKMQSLEMVEVNPILDEQNATAELAVELILSSLGKRIL